MILSVKHCEYQIRRPEQRCAVSSTLIVSGTQGLRILYFMFSQYFKPNSGNIWSDDQNNVVYLQLLSPRTQISHKLSFSISGGSLFLSVMMPGPLGWTGRSDWCRCHTHSLFMGGKIMSIHHHMWVTQRGSDGWHCHQDISKALPLWHPNLWSQQYAPSWCPLLDPKQILLLWSGWSLKIFLCALASEDKEERGGALEKLVRTRKRGPVGGHWRKGGDTAVFLLPWSTVTLLLTSTTIRQSSTNSQCLTDTKDQD